MAGEGLAERIVGVIKAVCWGIMQAALGIVMFTAVIAALYYIPMFLGSLVRGECSPDCQWFSGFAVLLALLLCYGIGHSIFEERNWL